MRPEFSIVVPVYNEAENVVPLAHEIARALKEREYEMLFVDDGSTDETARLLVELRDRELPRLRVLRHSRRGGQSAAVWSGIRHARAAWVGTLDGDGQNDPADLLRLFAAALELETTGVRLLQGHRRARRDTAWRRLQSRIANGFRSLMLGDATPDTGCGIKVMHRETALQLPYFDHMHRFMPALFLRQGAGVLSLEVNHRARGRGQSKYGMFDRLWVGIVDIVGVMWLKRRYRPGLVVREEPPAPN